jgi:hypothetical protein
MKKLFPVIVMLLLPALNGQNVQAGSGTEILSTQAKLEKRLATAERWQRWSPMATNNALQAIVDLMKKPDLDSGVRREATKRLIKIYYAVDDSSLTNNANKKRILEAIGRSDNSEEAQKFFLDVLGSDNKEYRRMALWSISPYGTHGDAIYDKIKSLESTGILTKGDSLVQLANANPERAIEEIKEFLKTTQDLNEFVGVALNLPKKYHSDPDTLDVIIDRYEDFKSKPIPAGHKGYTPEGAILSEHLWKYIDVREGKRLKTAMEIIRAKGVCYDNDIPRLLKKIKSANATTREATSDFLDSQIDSGNLPKEKVLPILEEARNGEHDQKLKKKLGEIISRRKKGGRP